MTADPTWTYPRAEVLDVHDGDTCKLAIDVGLSTFRHITIRIAHINAPELHATDGIRARDRLIELLARSPLVVTTIKDRTEKYGRYLAEITNADGIDVGSQLITEGLAVAYEGGTR